MDREGAGYICYSHQAAPSLPHTSFRTIHSYPSLAWYRIFSGSSFPTKAVTVSQSTSQFTLATKLAVQVHRKLLPQLSQQRAPASGGGGGTLEDEDEMLSNMWIPSYHNDAANRESKGVEQFVPVVGIPMDRAVRVVAKVEE